MSQPRATGPIAKSGLEVLTFSTPNGYKATIALEELKEAYGKDYVFQSIPIMENIQKEPWFTKLGPNGRIPVLIDHDKGGLPIMEGQAILQYLTRHYDHDHKISFVKDPELSECEQWIAWQHGGLSPMQGQANHFYRLSKERLPYPTQRFVGETERLYGILDNRLKDRDYIVGSGKGKYSIADIANFSWVNFAYFVGIQLDQFPNLYKWWERVDSRPAVQKGTAVPSVNKLGNKKYQERLKEEPEFKAKEDELAEICKKAKEQYGYKYSSPTTVIESEIQQHHSVARSRPVEDVAKAKALPSVGLETPAEATAKVCKGPTPTAPQKRLKQKAGKSSKKPAAEHVIVEFESHCIPIKQPIVGDLNVELEFQRSVPGLDTILFIDARFYVKASTKCAEKIGVGHLFADTIDRCNLDSNTGKPFWQDEIFEKLHEFNEICLAFSELFTPDGTRKHGFKTKTNTKSMWYVDTLIIEPEHRSWGMGTLALNPYMEAIEPYFDGIAILQSASADAGIDDDMTALKKEARLIDTYKRAGFEGWVRGNPKVDNSVTVMGMAMDEESPDMSAPACASCSICCRGR